jgi:hypothetical protein
MDKILRDEIKARSSEILKKFWELKGRPPAEQLYWFVQQWAELTARVEKLEQKIGA